MREQLFQHQELLDDEMLVSHAVKVSPLTGSSRSCGRIFPAAPGAA
jgi:hypothetical protein